MYLFYIDFKLQLRKDEKNLELTRKKYKQYLISK